MPGLRVCIDVDDLERAVAFYTRALGLATGRRSGEEWVELLGAPCPIDLLAKPPGTAALPLGTRALRDYERHWTPVHLDVRCACRCGGGGCRLDYVKRDRLYWVIVRGHADVGALYQENGSECISRGGRFLGQLQFADLGAVNIGQQRAPLGVLLIHVAAESDRTVFHLDILRRNLCFQ